MGLPVVAVGLWLCVLTGRASAQRVLVVTTDAGQLPAMTGSYNGASVIADLAGAGYPFDVVNYTRFVSMDLSDHDVIIVNGHVSPNPIDAVVAKCQSAMAEGRKIFINGYYCYRQYDCSGQQIGFSRYSLALFGVKSGQGGYVDARPCLPTALRKDYDVGIYKFTHYWVNDFKLKDPPPLVMTMGGKVIGFLYPEGGVLETTDAFALSWLDYGKIVSFLRHGRSEIVGFAPDRIGSKPVVSIEVHCDSTNNLAAIDGLNRLATSYEIPLTNLLVYNRLSGPNIDRWNSVASQFMAMGSHSRSHPTDWPSLPSALYETADALDSQRMLIPTTGVYMNFSGSMNPTTAQIDQIYSAGVLFGAAGGDERLTRTPIGTYTRVQRVPTRDVWIQNLAASTVTPYCLSQTLASDFTLWQKQKSYFDETKTDFASNVRYGLYTYGYIHDYMLDTSTNYYVNGVHVSALIESAFAYLKSRSVIFIPTSELVLRLRDFLNGSITYTDKPNGGLHLTVSRPAARANQVKVQTRDGLLPVASGESVVSQHLCGNLLYIDLRPETVSTLDVDFADLGASSISEATAKPDGAYVAVSGNVSAVFPGYCYIEQPDRSRGVRLIGNFVTFEGERIAVTGFTATQNGERVILVD